MNIKLKNNNSGFTLIELMTVIAIIGILASAIMISLGVQKKRATVNKVLTELSGVMENIYLCKSDDGTVNAPDTSTNGGNDICDISGNYGKWPNIGDDEFSYPTGISFSTSTWYYSAIPSDSSMETICCNSTSGKCGKVTVGCDANTPIK